MKYFISKIFIFSLTMFFISNVFSASLTGNVRAIQGSEKSKKIIFEIDLSPENSGIENCTLSGWFYIDGSTQGGSIMFELVKTAYANNKVLTIASAGADQCALPSKSNEALLATNIVLGIPMTEFSERTKKLLSKVPGSKAPK